VVRPTWRRDEDAEETVPSLILLEFGDFAMMRRMLLGIRARAERHRDAASAEPATAGSADPGL
jgi:hypothetical protein